MKSKKSVRVRAYVILTVVSMLWLLPVLILISSSISNNDVIIKEGYWILPRELDFAAYRYLFSQSSAILHALLISFAVMLIGTLISVLLTAMLAYPLTKKKLKGKSVVLGVVLFTILFNGGMVPSYVVYTQILSIQDTFFALIIPNLLMSGFNIILMRTYFMTNVPESLIEAAEIDGVGHVGAFFRIVLPLSMPIFATVGLMQATLYWNDWFNAMLYIDDPSLLSLQAVMNQMLNNLNYLSSLSQGGITGSLGGVQASPPTATIRMAMAVVGILPSLIIFPFAQKYLVKGLTLGGNKE